MEYKTITIPEITRPDVEPVPLLDKFLNEGWKIERVDSNHEVIVYILSK